MKTLPLLGLLAVVLAACQTSDDIEPSELRGELVFSTDLSETGAIVIGNNAMRIEYDGDVFWKRDGDMVQAKTDRDLSKAFARAIISLDPYCDSRSSPHP
jgi:hypothetical protein